MALVIEDGSIVSGAESYATVAEARTYASKRGVTLSAVDADVEVLLIKAMDYLQSFHEQWKGLIVRKEQPLSWPRSDVVIDNYGVDFDTIPNDIKNAQIELAMSAQTIDLLPTVLPESNGAVTKEKVDVLEVEYAEPTYKGTVARFASTNALINKYLQGGAGGFVSVARA